MRVITSAALLVTLCAGTNAQEPDLAAVLAHAGRYASDYEQRFSLLVAEELYAAGDEARGAQRRWKPDQGESRRRVPRRRRPRRTPRPQVRLPAGAPGRRWRMDAVSRRLRGEWPQGARPRRSVGEPVSQTVADELRPGRAHHAGQHAAQPRHRAADDQHPDAGRPVRAARSRDALSVRARRAGTDRRTAGMARGVSRGDAADADPDQSRPSRAATRICPFWASCGSIRRRERS